MQELANTALSELDIGEKLERMSDAELLGVMNALERRFKESSGRLAQLELERDRTKTRGRLENLRAQQKALAARVDILATGDAMINETARRLDISNSSIEAKIDELEAHTDRASEIEREIVSFGSRIAAIEAAKPIFGRLPTELKALSERVEKIDAG